MHSNMRRYIAIIAIGSGFMLPFQTAVAQIPDPKSLSAQWVQWALSIPTPVNPLLDTTGEDCMVGQSGSFWFLAGVFGGGTATRACSVPAGTDLFFPAADFFSINTPNVCGQDSTNLTVAQLRAFSADFVGGVSPKSVTVDGQPVAHVQRITSKVFDVALPEDNVFDAPCMAADLGNVPAGIYSPAVDDGFYVILRKLSVGTHTLQIKAKNPTASFDLNVTYNLTVVPVTLQ